MTDVDAVMVANQAFYDAHEQQQFAAMEAVWEQGEGVTCIHPGWPILRGWEAVADSWRRILEGGGNPQFILTNEQTTIAGDHAWVTLNENLISGEDTGTIAATNVFARQPNGDWLMVLHHGSPVVAARSPGT